MPITVGSVEVLIIPNAQGIQGRLRSAILPAANQVGTEAGEQMGGRLTEALQARLAGAGVRIGRRLGEEISREIRTTVRDALPDAIRTGGKLAAAQGGRAGADTGGAFSREMKTRVEAAVRSIPNIKVGINTTEAESDLQALRVRMESLRDKRIGIDIGAEDARAEAESLEAELRRLGAISPNVRVKVDTDRAIAELAAMREQIRIATLKPWEIKFEVDGSFGARMRAAVEAAQASLPNINIDATTAPARARIQGLRAELDLLRDVRIGIDMDAGAAQAKIDFVRAELAALSRDKNIDIDVRVDSAKARAELKAVQIQADILDRKRINIAVSTGSAIGNIVALAAITATLVVPPAIGVMAAALGALTAATVTAAVGFGALALVALPAIMKITGALQAKKAASDAAANADEKAGKSGNQQAIQSAQQALQMEGAQQSLTQAYRQAAQQRSQALRAVTDAQKAVGDAERQVSDARQGVAKAEQAVADARQQAAERAAAAADKVRESERKLGSAQEDARIAQLDLTQARKDAATQLQDLNDRLEGAALDQRAATLRVQGAQEELNKTLVDPKATQLQRDEAQLTFEQAVQHLKDQGKENLRLQQQVDDANKAGVEGSDLVTRAQKNLVDANTGVANAARDLKDSQSEATKTQVEGARQVADAQQQVVSAQRGVADAQQQVADANRKVVDAQQHVSEVAVQSAEQIASAQRGITSAQLSAAAAAEQAAGGTDAAAVAAAKYQRALDGMNPATRSTYDAVLRLKDAFKAWSDALSPAVMPLVTRFVDGLTNSLPGLTPIVLAAAEGMGRLMDRASAGFKSPWWVQFKADFVDAMPAAIEGMGVAFGNVFKALAGIIGAFLPHMDSISARMQAITGRFANWGAGLRGSPEFEEFLANASRNAPALGEALSGLAHAFAALSNSLDPFRGPLLDIITAFAAAITWIAREAPWLIQGLFMAAIAFRAVAFAIALVNLTSAANPFVLLAAAIIAVIGLIVIYWDEIVAGLKWVYEKTIKPYVDLIGAAAVWLWDGYLKPTFDAIAAGASWLWDKGLKPAVDGIVAGWNAVAAGASWLWGTILEPIFNGFVFAVKVLAAIIAVILVAPLLAAWNIIAGLTSWLWDVVLKPAFDAFGQQLAWIGGVLGWLWREVFVPAWNGIATAASWAWDTLLKPSFEALGTYLGWLGDLLSWLWLNIFEPAWDGISTAVSWAWEHYLKPALDATATEFEWIGNVLDWLWRQVFAPIWNAIGTTVSWIWTTLLKPTFDAIGSGMETVGNWAQKLYGTYIKPYFDLIGEAVSDTMAGMENAFSNAKEGISNLWDGLKEIVAVPVRFVVDRVYNQGIKAVWNWVAEKVGLPTLPDGKAEFADGGIYPGYTPGRDIGLAAVSGGEAIMRPEWTRAVGPGFVDTMNAAARSGGVSGVRAAMAAEDTPFAGRYFLGGIVGDVVDSVRSGISAIPGADWVIDKAANFVRGALTADVELRMKPIRALIDKVPGDNAWAGMARGIPNKVIDGLLSWVKKDDKEQSESGVGVAGAALREAMTYAGVPYLWGGTSRLGIDCSGLTQAAYLAAGTRIGRTTYDQVKVGRHVEMKDAAPGDLVFEQFEGPSPSHVGLYMRPGTIWDASRPGQPVGESPIMNVVDVRRMAADASGIGAALVGNVGGWLRAALVATGSPPEWIAPLTTIAEHESGGNPKAENHWDSNQKYGGTFGLMQTIPPTFNAYKLPGMDDILNPIHNASAAIRYIKAVYGTPYNTPGIRSMSNGGQYMGYKSGGIVPMAFDSGGYLPPGLNFTYNGTGRPEPVFTGAQSDALFAGTVGGDGGTFTGELRLSTGEFLGVVDGRIERGNDQLATRLGMGRG